PPDCRALSNPGETRSSVRQNDEEDHVPRLPATSTARTSTRHSGSTGSCSGSPRPSGTLPATRAGDDRRAPARGVRLAAGADAMTVVDAVRGWRRDHAAEVLREFAGLVALDNVTGDVPALRRNAEEIVERLRVRGVEAESVGPDGVAPLVIGRVPGRAGAPRLGLYAHYDGQPVTPADWTTPPFEPTLVGPDGATVPLPAPGAPVDDEWRLRARAAADDKAPIAALLAALDALGGTEREVELVLCFEGEEESGSPHLGELLLAYADRLAAGAWLICDGPVRQGNAPPNPARALARLLASMEDDAGRVTIDGFTADTRPPTAAEQAALDAMPPVEDELLDRLGLAAAEVPGS